MKKKKFTLIELLIVIAIIGLLIGIAVPVFNGVRQRAKRTKAKAEMSSIETAIKSYEMTYGVLPVPGSWTNGTPTDIEYDNLMSFLTNVGTQFTDITADANGNYNSRGIRFLDVPNNFTSNSFVDPWDSRFKVYLDTDYDGQISGPGGETLYGSVFLYAFENNDNTDTVYSWK